MNLAKSLIFTTSLVLTSVRGATFYDQIESLQIGRDDNFGLERYFNHNPKLFGLVTDKSTENIKEGFLCRADTLE